MESFDRKANEDPVAAVSKPALSRSLKWGFVMSWSQQGISLVLSFVLAAILGPTEFGVLAMGLVLVEFLYQLLEQGIGPTLVQRADLQPRHLDSVFWALLAGGMVFWGITAAVSYWWADLNNVPRLASVLVALGAVIPIRSAAVVPQAVLQRALDFRLLAIRSCVSVVVGGAVALSMAIAGLGVWALVGQQLATAGAETVLLLLTCGWIPSRTFSLAALRELARFSFSVFVGNMGTFVGARIDVFLIGLFFGPLAVGLYRFASRLVSFASELTMRPFHAVTLPHLATHHDDLVRQRGVLVGAVRASSNLSIPSMGALAAMASPILAILGPEWLPARTAMQVLCLLGVMKAVTVFTGPGLLAAGRAVGFAVYSWFLALCSAGVLVVAGLWLRESGVEQQLVGLAWARVLGVGVASIIVAVFVLTAMSGISAGKVVRLVAPGFFGGATTFFVGQVAADALGNRLARPAAWLAVSGCAVSLICAGCIIIAWPELRGRIGRAWGCAIGRRLARSQVS